MPARRSGTPQRSIRPDTLCVGELTDVRLPALRTLVITAQGRGGYQRTNVDASGFPRGYFTRAKRIHGFSTGDLVRAEVPGHLKTGGVHLGRIAVRAVGSFRVGKMDGINAKYCRVVQRLDGYDYGFHCKQGSRRFLARPQGRDLRAARR